MTAHLDVTAVTRQAAAAPPFGQADLTNCEREQIHLAGSIQPHGALLVLREPELVIIQASANAANFLELPADLLGRPLSAVVPELAACLGPHLSDPLDVLPHRLDLFEAIAEGDYIEFGTVGAYGLATATRFNGYGAHKIVAVEHVLEM